MRHIPKEDKYLVIYNLFSHKTFICWMLPIQPGLYFFIVRNVHTDYRSIFSNRAKIDSETYTTLKKKL